MVPPRHGSGRGGRRAPEPPQASSKVAKGLVVLLLLVSATLILIVAIGGWDVLQGAKAVQVAYVVLYVPNGGARAVPQAS